MPLELFDSHNHLYFDKFDADRDAVIERARQAGVVGQVCIAEDAETARQCVELANRVARYVSTQRGAMPKSPEHLRLAVERG
jgi:TatD DNase family protein